MKKDLAQVDEVCLFPERSSESRSINSTEVPQGGLLLIAPCSGRQHSAGVGQAESTQLFR